MRARPCRRCGATRAHRWRVSFVYGAFKLLGYRLCRCARCNRLRLVPRHPHERKEEEPEIIAEVEEKEPAPNQCPHCGSSDYRRSQRRWSERLTKSPKMARCRECGTRFPYPERGPSDPETSITNRQGAA